MNESTVLADGAAERMGIYHPWLGATVSAGNIDRGLSWKLLEKRNACQLRKRPGIRDSDENIHTRLPELLGNNISLRFAVDKHG